MWGLLIFQQNPYRSPRGLHTSISLTRMLVQAQTSVTQKNGMILNWNLKKKKKKNDPKLRPKKYNDWRCKLQKFEKKCLMRIDFSVTVSYSYHIILSLLTLMWDSLCESILTWLDLRYSLSLVLIIGKGFGGFFTPEGYNFVETFKCHMDFALGLVWNDRFFI